MIEFDFLNPEEIIGVIKAVIHKSTGRLGFSMAASKKMDLENLYGFRVALNKQDKEDRSLYFLPVNEASDGAFKLYQAGNYHYLKLKNTFDSLGIDYMNETITYTIQEMNDGPKKYFRLIQKKSKLKDKK